MCGAIVLISVSRHQLPTHPPPTIASVSFVLCWPCLSMRNKVTLCYRSVQHRVQCSQTRSSCCAENRACSRNGRRAQVMTEVTYAQCISAHLSASQHIALRKRVEMFIRLSFRLLRLLACSQRRSPVQKAATPHQRKQHPVFFCTCCALVHRGQAFAMIISFVIECFPLQSCRSRARNPDPQPKSLFRQSFPRPLFGASLPPVPAILSRPGSLSPSPVGLRGPREAGLFL
jgi:hypothetical protein